MATKLGGYAGKILRVDLSTGRITTEPTEKYLDYLGGVGFGYKVLWDEVKPGTKAFDPENRLIFGVGPLTGTGAPCGGRTSITSLFPTVYPIELVGTGHMGGHWGAELKFAGWDGIIIQGKADHPVWLSITDDKVEIRDARRLWGNGIYRTTAEICAELGAETQVAAIGQAGENMVRLANIMNSYSHSAGGLGGVMGSKNLKAIAVRGSGAVKIAAGPKAWKDLNRYILSLVGANNQHVVPSTPQPWAEYYDPSSRWTARKGLYWGAASPPVETGDCDPHDLNRIGYRTMKAVYDLGPLAERYTVRMGGCHSCPVRCHIHLDVPSVEEKYGYSRYAANTCMGWGARNVFGKGFPDGPRGLTSIEAAVLGKHLADDYGVWCNYGLLYRDFNFAYKNGIIKERLGADEYKSIPWDKYEKGDPEFLFEFYRRIAFKIGEFGTALGEGSGRLAARWKFPEEYFKDHEIAHWKMGHPKHHSVEDYGQVGALINMLSNRDPMCHSHTNFIRNGLPTDVQKRILEKLFGPGYGDGVDRPKSWMPMNPYKAKLTKFFLIRQQVHDSLTLCNWMYPWLASPLKERNYLGDTTLEAKLFAAATGLKVDEKELDLIGERLLNLFRALTIRDMGTKDMRNQHDLIPDWVFDYPPDKQPFTPGHDKMDRQDMEKAKDLFYQEMGWDVKTGAPTRATLERVGLKDVADWLGKHSLLP